MNHSKGMKAVKSKEGESRFGKFMHNSNTVGYVFSAPFILGFLCFTLIPMGFSLFYSFTDYITLKPDAMKWVGLQNYIDLLKDRRFLNSMWVTLKFVVISVPAKLIFALFVAYLLTKKSRMVSVYRSIYYLPSLIGGSVAVALVWRQLFARKGLINLNLMKLGIENPPNWFGDKALAAIPLIIMMVWQFGSSMLIFAAGLKEIPSTYYEAADIDGASGSAKFFRITLPCLSPVIMFNLVMQTIQSFMVFTQAKIITDGGPADSTMYYALYLYEKGIHLSYMGYACAMSWMMLLIMAAVVAIIFRTSNYWVFYEGE